MCGWKFTCAVGNWTTPFTFANSTQWPIHYWVAIVLDRLFGSLLARTLSVEVESLPNIVPISFLPLCTGVYCPVEMFNYLNEWVGIFWENLLRKYRPWYFSEVEPAVETKKSSLGLVYGAETIAGIPAIVKLLSASEEHPVPIIVHNLNIYRVRWLYFWLENFESDPRVSFLFYFNFWS